MNTLMYLTCSLVHLILLFRKFLEFFAYSNRSKQHQKRQQLQSK